MLRLEGVDHVALAVRDVPRAAAWYRDVLGLERWFQEPWGDVPTVMGVGTTAVALFPVATPDPGEPGRDALSMRHLAFRATRVMFEAAQARLESLGIPFEFQDHAIAHSIYFHDPDGHRLEITTYEV